MKSFKGEGKSKVTNGMSATPAFSGGFINNLYFSRTVWPRQKVPAKISAAGLSSLVPTNRKVRFVIS